MTCIIRDNYLEIVYDCGSVEKATVDQCTGIITFIMRDGKVIYTNVTDYVLPETAYLKQFGICITSDGKYFFIQSWEKGLFCFELETGSLHWHCKRKKAYNLAVGKHGIICRFFDQYIAKLDIATGEIKAHVPMGHGTNCYSLTDDMLLVGPKRKMYYIIDHDLKKVAVISESEMNPHLFDSFIITKACLSEDRLLITGYEYSNEDDQIQGNSGRCTSIEDHMFYRLVPINYL